MNKSNLKYFDYSAEPVTDEKLHWAIRLRKHLLISGIHRWNGWVRDITARLEKP